MAYDFSTLSPADFEDLMRDLVGRELRIRFEGFGAGPDGGMDGRHAAGEHSIVLQAKHYVGSTYAALKSAMRRERTSIDRLSPDRYILATSRALSPKNKEALASLIGPNLKSQSDILSCADLNGLLRKFPDVEKANIKLWLSSSSVLERVIRSAAYSFTATSRSEIDLKVRVYAQNPSFKQARDKLESNHVLIVSGPPGVGKTTLAEMLSYAYIGEEWEFVAIRSLDDGFAAIVDAKKQIFFFDDFLGKIALDTRSLAAKDSDLAKFIRRIQATSNARFILTTRAYIFEEARRVSEHLADQRLDITKYVLDVGIYTRRIKARILYNHLIVGKTPRALIQALWGAGVIPRIVDHKNYNPRIIEAMTDTPRIGNFSPDEYVVAFLEALDNPHQLWDIAFRMHIPPMCRHLLFCLFFCSEYGVEIEELKLAFDALHPPLCRKYSISYDAKDFEGALKILEGSFIAIRGSSVSFINPSVRDYLTDYLQDLALLSDFARAAQKANYAAAIWRYVQAIHLPLDEQLIVTRCFLDVADAFIHLPVMKRIAGENSYRFYDMHNSDRISLLLEWWKVSDDERYFNFATLLADNPVGGFSPWEDGNNLVDLIFELRVGRYNSASFAENLADKLENRIVELLENGMWPDDLERMGDAIERTEDVLSERVVNSFSDAIIREIDDAGINAASIDSESTLEDHVKTLQKWSGRAGVELSKLESAISAIQERISEINERATDAGSPSFSGRAPHEADRFDDVALNNLFAPLISE